MLFMPSGTISIVIIIVINLVGTQQHSYGTLNAGTVSVDSSQNIGFRSSVEQLAKYIQENVFFKALLDKSLAKATGQLVESLNFTDGGNKRQSLTNFLIALLPSTHAIKDDVQHTSPATIDLGHAEIKLVKSFEDSFHGFEVVDPKQSLLETFAGVNEDPGGTDYKSGNSNAILDTVLDEDDDDLDFIITQTLADDTDDDDSYGIHLILGDRNGETPKNFDAEKFEDISLMSNILREILSDDSDTGDSSDIHVFTQDQRSMDGSDDMHLLTQDDIERATLNGKNAATLDGINLEVLNGISKTSLNKVNIDGFDDNAASLNVFNAASPNINKATRNVIHAATLNAKNISTPNDIFMGASNGINEFRQHDVNMPTTRDTNVQIPNEPTSHKQLLGVFAHDAKPSEILLKFPEKLVTLLQSGKLSEISQYLPGEVNAYKSLVKQEGADSLVYSQGNNPWLSNEKLLQLLGQRLKIPLELKEQREPFTKSIERFPDYYQYYESDDNLPNTNPNTGLHIDSKYLDDLYPGFYSVNFLKEQLQWPRLVKGGVQSSISPHLWKNSQLLKSIPSTPGVDNRVQSPIVDKPRQIQAWLESIPLRERESILDKTDTLLREYKDHVKDGLLQVLYKQFRKPDKTYNRFMSSHNYDIVPSVKTNLTKIIADDSENDSGPIDQIVLNLLNIDDLPDTKPNALKLGYRNNYLKANYNQQVEGQYIATTNSERMGSQNNLNFRVDEYDVNNPPRRSKRSKEWPQSDAGSVNHKFRNKKLFLTQHFQIMKHEKSQETRQMAGVDSKMNQILPWGISVQSEVRDLYEADRPEPPLLSRDHEEDGTVSVVSGDDDKTASVISGDKEANLSRNGVIDGVIDTAILNLSNSGLIINSTNFSDIYKTPKVNLLIPPEGINLNNTFTNQSNLVRSEAKEKEDILSNVINKRNFDDYLHNETINTETGYKSLINNNITFLDSSVQKINASNFMENGTIKDEISRRELNVWNGTSVNTSQINAQDFGLNASLAFTNSSSLQNNNESVLFAGIDQGSRVKRDIKTVQSTSRGGSNVEQVPSWMFHHTTKPTSTDERKQATPTTRPEQSTLPSTRTGKKTNLAVQDQYSNGYVNSNAKADTSRQFRPTVVPSPSSFVENNQKENTVETQTRPPDAQGSTEAYITRYLREKENAQKLGRKRDLSSNIPPFNRNKGSNRDYSPNSDEQRRKVISPETYYESKSNYPYQGEKSGSTYADRFLQNKNQRQPTARLYNTKQAEYSKMDSYRLTAQNDRDGSNQRKSYKFISKGDRSGNDQTDSYKLTDQNDRDGNDQTDSYKYKLTDQNDRDGIDQTDSYKLTAQNDWSGSDVQGPQPEQQVSSTDVDGVQIQDLALEGGDLLQMVPPEPMVVHYQPVITYYTPPIHYSQIPEYMDFTSKLFTPTDPGQWDTSIKDTDQGQDVQSMSYPNHDQQVSAVNEPKLDQGISIKHNQGGDQFQEWTDDVQTDSIIYDSNTDQQMTVNKQHKNQQTYDDDDTNQWSSTNDQIVHDNVQSNYWGEDSYYTNDYQNTQTGSGNYNQKHNFRKQSQRVNKNRKFSNPTNFGTNNLRNLNRGTYINDSTKQNYKNTNQARPYYTQKNNQYNKKRTSHSTSTEDDMDDEAVLQFIISQKKMNTGQSGMSSTDSQDYSSSSTSYQVMDSAPNNQGGQTKEDKMIDDIVEHFIYFKPKYGYGQSNNNKMGLL